MNFSGIQIMFEKTTVQNSTVITSHKHAKLHSTSPFLFFKLSTMHSTSLLSATTAQEALQAKC